MTDNTNNRNATLREMLNERRREVQDGELDYSDADLHGDIELMLVQMKAETLTHIDEALVRLDAGQYGICFACFGSISERRLRALPFAVRCCGCDEEHERVQGRARRLAQRRGSLTLFPEVARS